MKQRILSLFIAIAMILMLIPTSAFADGEESGHNHVVDGYCAVCGTGTPSSEEGEEVYDESAPDVAYIGETPYKSLTAAISAAAEGDSIQITSDIYITKSITVNKTITLTGGYTIYRDFSGDALFNITSGGKITLNNITVDGNSSNYSGYSLFNVLSGGKLVISSDTTLKNSRAGYGGAVYIANGGNLNFDSGEITQCTADYAGGAIYNEGDVYLYGSANITGNTSGCGGAIRTSGNVYVDGSISVTGNTDFNGAANNIHLDGSVLHLDQELTGSVGVTPHDTSTIEGQTIGANDGQYFGADYITYDADSSYYGMDQEDGSIILTQGQSSQGSDAEPSPISDPEDPENPEDPEPEPEEPEVVYYTVSFDSQAEGITAPETQTIVSGEYAADPGSLTREGYTFDGWYADGAESSFDFANTPITSSITLYAHWTENPTYYTVSFDSQVEGITAPETQTIVSGGYAADPGSLTREGYTFDGWYAEGAEPKFDFANTQITSSITLYAHWTEVVPESYVVTFITTHGSVEPSEVTVTDGSTVSQPADPTADGWTFGGWYTDEACTTAYDFNTPVTSYMILYAKWTERPAETCVVTFSTAHGSVSPSQVTVNKGEKVTQPTNPTADGWVFEGWYTDQSYATQYDFNSAVNDNITLYAKWSELKITYSVTFYTRYGTTPEGQLIVSGDKVTKPADPAQTGWIFGGWYTDETCTAAYDFNAPVTSSMTLYAKWTQVPVTYYTVTFINSKGAAPSAQTIESGKTAVKPNDPTYEGFVFGGWYTDQDCKNMFNFTTAITANVTLYAKWTELPTASYSVSFNANGHGTAPNPQTVKSGEKATKPTDPTATGYIFAGWFTDTQGTTAYNFNNAVSSNLQLYAKWTAIRYTVKFDANGGSGTMQSQTYVYDSAATLPANTLTRTGYVFAGWNTKADGSGTSYEDKSQIKNLTATSGATVNLYAQWKNLYNVIEGIGAKYQKGAATTLLFRLDGDYSKFTGITIDGNNVATTQYDSWQGATKGGTYVEIHADYMNQMPTGTHTIKFQYTDGSCETTIEVVTQATPKTGDTNNIVLWIIIAIAALIVIAVVIIIILVRRRRGDDDEDYEIVNNRRDE